MALSAVLAAGLPEGSRSMRRIKGPPTETLLLAGILDALNLWIWAHSDKARRGERPPTSVTDRLTGREGPEKAGEKLRSFASGADFEAAWEAAVRR